MALTEEELADFPYKIYMLVLLHYENPLLDANTQINVTWNLPVISFQLMVSAQINLQITKRI